MSDNQKLTSIKTITTDPGQRYTGVWEHVQRGLVYPSPHAVYASYWLKSDQSLTRNELRDLKVAIRTKIHCSPELHHKHTSASLGVGIARWKQIWEDSHMPLPKGLAFRYPEEGNENRSKVIAKSCGTFLDEGADLWFHIKSDEMEACEILHDFITDYLKNITGHTDAQAASSKSTQPDGKGGKVLGRRFSENLNNPTDPISIAKHCIVGPEDIDHLGGSYVMAQRFMINWDQLHSMSETQIEDIIGRKTDDSFIPDRDTRSHIKAARQQDDHGNTTPVLRLGLPFGMSDVAHCPYMLAKGSTISDEAGIYWAGFAKSFRVLETIMSQQIGSRGQYMHDRLFDNVKSNYGGFFYIPSIQDLGLDEVAHVESKWENKAERLWEGKNFPGMDWGRLDRHFDQSSPNGRMHYNHKEYMYSMATLTAKERKEQQAPTDRILSLLENSFMRWQDNWYIDRKQMELGEIDEYLAQFKKEYPEERAPEQLVDLEAAQQQYSIMLRKGWSVRLSLHVMSSDWYGFRGRRILMPDGTQKSIYEVFGDGVIDENSLPEGCSIINGADTFRIQPEEIIVGGLPNLSLGEGRYAMRYLSHAERMEGFFDNLSETSGVGHNIPSFEKILEKGFDGLLEDIATHRKAMQEGGLTDEEKQTKGDFYESCHLAIKGVQEYCLRYSALAKKMAEQCGKGEGWYRNNLSEIAERMEYLAHGAPRNFTEAVQAIYTTHSCLHLTGEPTALGRLDQVLYRFYQQDLESGLHTPESAQEVLDAFCIKLDEKVQANRIFVEDHQYFGNLAMGGASGPYPQGASINQWIQQLTVGGCDPDTGESAYNELTSMFIRCIRRMPLNAPCVSLRVRKDIPTELLKEAGEAILSGGAHPIFLNDDLFIDGLQSSGNNVGGDFTNGASGWDSQVTLRSARNYACDGCYEPQFPGENWFSLGGFSTLEPLECALNQGKTYSSAGMSYFYGKVQSFTSKHCAHIETFEELKELYFKHFDWLNRKAFNGQLMGFGANTAYCPSPLLSCLIDNCLPKGMDYYSGGAKYNIYGPCYIALSSAINSLYAIKKMVFDQGTAVTSLPELLNCLCCDWGYAMTEPFVSTLAGPARIAAEADRYKRLREVALSLPRYGRGVAEVDELGNEVIERIADLSVACFTEPQERLGERFKAMASQYGTEEHPFGLQIQPGVGTFENHVEMGAWNGASADGRRRGTTVASDMSAAPSMADLPVDHQEAEFSKALRSAGGSGARKMTEGAPTDFNIREMYPLDDLVSVMRQFADGEGSNLMTITVADPVSMETAMSQPEQYDLLRVRTGGWTAYFTAMFPNIQEQHRRRPLNTPAED
ncbi:Dyp-type peroxidase [Roseivirga sp. BDSF3-8]|uniref:Dyp-type peroxidase n=1 Tax=Roseivirga sp. BDSF3-8 TaxID=3241598 RepID=UPI003531B9B6